MSYSDAHMITALKETRPTSARQQYKKAWTFASLGFVLLIVSSVLRAYFWMRVFDDPYSIRDNTWTNSISTISNFIGVALIIVSVVFTIRGLLAENDMRRSGRILLGTLKSLEWVALIALTLYILYLPLQILGYVAHSNALLVLTNTNPAFLCLWALPVIAIRALEKQSL